MSAPMGTPEDVTFPMEFRITVRDFMGNKAAPVIESSWKVRVRNYRDLVAQVWEKVSGWIQGEAVFDGDGNDDRVRR